MSERGKYWARNITANVVAAAVVTIVFSGVTTRTPLRRIAGAYAVAFLFSTCIGPLLAIAMPRLGRRFWQRLPFPLNWVITMIAIVAIAIAGSAVAVAVLAAVGYIRPGHLAEWFAGTVRIAIIISLVFGTFITTYEVMRASVKQATAEARLAALESRVQPHFLFNTLNSIASLIHDDPAGAERMTGQLASLMRSSLAQQQALVTVDEELRTVASYLEIERVRFGDRLRYTIDAPDAVRSALVPRFAVQTLVENSVKYAVAPRREGGSIAVRIAAAGRRLTIVVEDDGPGFEVADATPGHGLALLRERLAALFGSRASLHVAAASGATRATIDIPAADLHVRLEPPFDKLRAAGSDVEGPDATV